MTKIEDVKTERDYGAMCLKVSFRMRSHCCHMPIRRSGSPSNSASAIRKPSRTCGNMPPWISPVMEISITDDIANAEDTRKSLAERITGTGHATRFAGREWLYSPAAKKILKRSWHIEQNHPINRSAIKEQIS